MNTEDIEVLLAQARLRAAQSTHSIIAEAHAAATREVNEAMMALRVAQARL